MPNSDVPDIIPEIESWLEANWEKINSFWLHAEWRAWARYDLYAHLNKGLCRQLRDDHPRWDYMISHSAPIWDGDDDTEVDMTITPAAEQKDQEAVAIWICTARPGENDTSFPDFVEKFREEWELVSGLVKKYGGGDLEGGKLLFLGLGEKAYDEDDFDFDGLQPDYHGLGGRTEYEGSVYMYYKWLDLESTS